MATMTVDESFSEAISKGMYVSNKFQFRNGCQTNHMDRTLLVNLNLPEIGPRTCKVDEDVEGGMYRVVKVYDRMYNLM